MTFCLFDKLIKSNWQRALGCLTGVSASPEVPMVQAVEKVIEIPMIGKTVPGRLGFFWSLLKSFNWYGSCSFLPYCSMLFHLHGKSQHCWSWFHVAFQADQHSGNTGAAKGGRGFFFWESRAMTPLNLDILDVIRWLLLMRLDWS